MPIRLANSFVQFVLLFIPLCIICCLVTIAEIPNHSNFRAQQAELSHITPPSGVSFCRRSWQDEKRDGVVQTKQVGRKPRKPQAETKIEQGPFGVLGKHESEGTPHQATDVSAPPVLVL